MDPANYKGSDFLSGAGKGLYVLVLSLKRNKRIVVGRRKDSSPILFRAGCYAYVGSAHGPGGLRSRISRHLIKDKKCRWHIDYLRKETLPVELWVSVEKGRFEKAWAHALADIKGSIPIENFGNTDDRGSRTHLYFFQHRPSSRVFSRLVRREIPDHGAIRNFQLD